MIRRRLIDHLDAILMGALIVAIGALWSEIGWWALALVPAYCAGALGMAAYARIPWR